MEVLQARQDPESPRADDDIGVRWASLKSEVAERFSGVPNADADMGTLWTDLQARGEQCRLGGPENVIELAPVLSEGRRGDTTILPDWLPSTMPAVDYGRYPVAAEAFEKNSLHVRRAVTETLVHWFFPWSIPFVCLFQGRDGVDMHGWWTHGPAHASMGLVARTKTFMGTKIGKPKLATKFSIFASLTGTIPMHASIVLLALGLIPMCSPVRTDIFLAAGLELVMSAIRGFKYGYRKPCESARIRIIDHASRRHEEHSVWLTLPEDWAVFLIRLAATRVGLHLDTRCILYNPTASPAETAALSDSELPFLRSASQVAPSLMNHVIRRNDGSVEVPVAVILLALVIPFCSSRYTAESCNYLDNVGRAGRLIAKYQFKSAILVGLLPTILRLSLLREPEQAWNLTAAEWVAAVNCFFVWFFGSAFMIGMIFQSCAMTFSRKLALQLKVCGLLTGTCPGFGPWRLSLDYSQAKLWNSLRKFALNFGKNYEKRSISTLILFFMVILVVKAFVLFMFLKSTLSGDKYSIRDEPVLWGMMGLAPFVFAPGLMYALAKGAALNDKGNRQLRQALIERRKSIVDAQSCLALRAAAIRTSVRCGTKGGCNGALPVDVADFDAIVSQLEHVDSYYEHVISEIDNVKPYVLLGWGGDGLFELSNGLVVQYFTENVVSLCFLSQIISFD